MLSNFINDKYHGGADYDNYDDYEDNYDYYEGGATDMKMILKVIGGMLLGIIFMVLFLYLTRYLLKCKSGSSFISHLSAMMMGDSDFKEKSINQAKTLFR